MSSETSDAVAQPRGIEEKSFAPVLLVGGRTGDLEAPGDDRRVLGPLRRRVGRIVAITCELDVERERRGAVGQACDQIVAQMVAADTDIRCADLVGAGPSPDALADAWKWSSPAVLNGGSSGGCWYELPYGACELN